MAAGERVGAAVVDAHMQTSGCDVAHDATLDDSHDEDVDVLEPRNVLLKPDVVVHARHDNAELVRPSL